MAYIWYFKASKLSFVTTNFIRIHENFILSGKITFTSITVIYLFCPVKLKIRTTSPKKNIQEYTTNANVNQLSTSKVIQRTINTTLKHIEM